MGTQLGSFSEATRNVIFSETSTSWNPLYKERAMESFLQATHNVIVFPGLRVFFLILRHGLPRQATWGKI